MTIDTVAILSALVGLFFGALIGTALGIKDEAKKGRRKWEDLINRAMADAYKAGLADGSAKDKKRPSGNK
jgi:Na+/glutamate symporter